MPSGSPRYTSTGCSTALDCKPVASERHLSTKE